MLMKLEKQLKFFHNYDNLRQMFVKWFFIMN